MSIAEGFFNAPDDVDIDDIELGAARMADSNVAFTIGDVSYMTYTFEDNSTLTIGSNGHLGCETPA
jgi:hypothetical protein